MTALEDVSAFQRQIDGLGEQMDKGFDEIKKLLRSYEERTRLIEIGEASCQPMVLARIEASWQKLVEHEVKLMTQDGKILKQDARLAQLMMMYKIFVFIGGALGLSMIALIWSLITGQAQVVFR